MDEIKETLKVYSHIFCCFPHFSGIGHSMNKKLESAGIITIADLQRASYKDLEAVVGSQSATSMKNSSFGIDNTAVTRSGPPQVRNMIADIPRITSVPGNFPSVSCTVNDHSQICKKSPNNVD